MVRNYTRKSNRSLRNEENLKNALEQVKSNAMSVKKASNIYFIPRTTLTRHLKNKVASPGKINLGCFRTVFSKEVEADLVKYIKNMQIKFFGLTRDAVCSLVYDYAISNKLKIPFNKEKKKAGPDWVQSFFKRHPELSLRRPESTGLARATGFNNVQVNKFFDLLKQIISDSNIAPDKIFNMDETEMSTVQRSQKIIAQKGVKQVGKISSAERGKTVTTICCINSSGFYVPPIFIFPRKRLAAALMNDAPQGAKGCTTNSRWTEGQIFYEWLVHFQNHVKASPQQKCLNILDNHSSHLYLPAINFARRNGI